jgi:hypothetical protein
MKKSDVTCSECGAGYRRIELISRPGTRGEFRCLVCDNLLDVGQPVKMGLADYLWFVRGNTTLNSVNSPGSVSTSMLPPCCFTIMSWLIDRPSPVPSPEGLVVKNGLNIFSLISSGIPVPLSRIRISTLSPRFLVVAAFDVAYCEGLRVP